MTHKDSLRLETVRVLITQTHSQSPSDLPDPQGGVLTPTDP